MGSSAGVEIKQKTIKYLNTSATSPSPRIGSSVTDASWLARATIIPSGQAWARVKFSTNQSESNFPTFSPPINSPFSQIPSGQGTHVPNPLLWCPIRHDFTQLLSSTRRLPRIKTAACLLRKIEQSRRCIILTTDVSTTT